MNHPIFKPHGISSVRTQGQLIISEVWGPWNIEKIMQWGQEYERFALELCKNGPTGTVSLFRGSVLTSPDALAILEKMARHSVKHHRLAATALVVDASVEGSVLVKSLFGYLYAGVMPFQIFPEMDEAVAFVQAHIDALRVP